MTTHTDGGLAATDPSASPIPEYVHANRWREYLVQQSNPFKELQEEREKGWRSEALDQWYQQRWSPSSGAAVLKDPSTPQNTNEVNILKNVEDKKETYFATADIPALTARYAQHAQRSWANPSFSAFFFSSARSASPQRGMKRRRSLTHVEEHKRTSQVFQPDFLDLGTAPGGVSMFLTSVLGWSGVGVTLHPAEGGIAVHAPLLKKHSQTIAVLSENYLQKESSIDCSSPDVEHEVRDSRGSSREIDKQSTLSSQYLLYYGDVTRSEKTWVLCDPSLQSKDTTTREQISAPQNALGGIDETVQVFPPAGVQRFRFVHAGAVQDYGQRQRRSVEEERALPSEVHNSAILPWFTLLLPQLTTALHYVENGGSFLVVYGVPHCASFFILMQLLRLSLGPKVRIRVCETMHIGKTPVYLLCENVEVRRGPPGGAVSKDRLTEVISAMDPLQQIMCPSFVSPTLTAVTGTREEKERFWLGESDLGFRVAQDGFSAFHRDVENVWKRMTSFLRKRRERAEEEMSQEQHKHHR